MDGQLQCNQTLVREIEDLGRRWEAWRQGAQYQNRAVELLCGPLERREGPEIMVEREEFNVGGEIMVCQHPECGGFVRGLHRCEGHVYWVQLCRCPECEQRYVIRLF